MIKVMCVDDQTLLKETLIYMLSRDQEIEAIDGGSDGYEGIENCEKFRPDIILMDVRMPKLDGIEAARRIKSRYVNIKVIILTTFEDETSILKAIENGVDGYVVKDTTPEELIMAVKAVYSNLFIMHKSVIGVVKDELVENHTREQEVEEMVSDYELTPIEVRIIRLMVDGKSNKEIATELSFTEGTIKNKVSKMLSKLHLKDRTQVAVFAIKHNLI